MKKQLAMLLTLVMLLSLPGCGAGTELQTTAPDIDSPITEPTATEAPRERVTLTIGVSNEYKDYDTNALTLWLEEEYNCDLQFCLYSEAEYTTPQTPANSYVPDIVYGSYYSPEAARPYVEGGYLLDLTEYFNDRQGASKIFWDRIETELTRDQQDYLLQAMSDIQTGKIYGVPTVNIYTRNHRPWINRVWLDALGLEMPTNARELYDVLVAFKENAPTGDGTIPLFGSQKAIGSAHVVDWLINMFLYYDPENPWQDYDRDGQLELVYTQDAYRDALKFANKLYEEGLLSSMAYSANSNDMQGITTPESGNAFCGIFLGDLETQTAEGSTVLYDYVPLPLWGNAIDESTHCWLGGLISGNCQNPDRAFEVLMAFWSWEGATRAAYGEYGKNWDYADPGTLDLLGAEAAWKQLEPIEKYHNVHWEVQSSGLYYRGEEARVAQKQQVGADADPWRQYVSKMNQEANRLFAIAAERNDFQTLGPYFQYTREEERQIWDLEETLVDQIIEYQQTFVLGFVDVDINDDAQWEQYLQQLQEMGLEDWRTIVQAAYER